ncbi:MAG: hypothetical protein BZY88_05755 [SAR202 cluster bacterium Io17-Chloro-G9]|nr:MAG: hypothetical protein BZY88_05755 [SAR202 cluster bacterium Io17-Chloro-G9]
MGFVVLAQSMALPELAVSYHNRFYGEEVQGKSGRLTLEIPSLSLGFLGGIPQTLPWTIKQIA